MARRDRKEPDPQALPVDRGPPAQWDRPGVRSPELKAHAARTPGRKILDMLLAVDARPSMYHPEGWYTDGGLYGKNRGISA